jgi:hypothetical protein
VLTFRHEFPASEITSGDIRTGQDFLQHDCCGQFDLVITNPPYSLAMEFIKRALRLWAKCSAVVTLLHVNSIAGQERKG